MVKRNFAIKWSLLLMTLPVLFSCDKIWSPDELNEAQLDSKQIRQVIPSRVNDRSSWAEDMESIMDELNISKDLKNVCTIVAVVDQESNFVADPKVPGLGEKAAKEIQQRFESKFGKPISQVLLHILKTEPSAEQSYMQQIRNVHTEQQLDKLYREMFDFFATNYHVKLMSDAAQFITRQNIAEQFNPITTLGSMQVHISYAMRHSGFNKDIIKLRTELYTQRGGMYYGIHRLMTYPAKYDDPIYRFADYNSGMYSSRNAAVQKMVGEILDHKIDLDGDLLMYQKDGTPRKSLSLSEKLVNQAINEENSRLKQGQIRRDLVRERYGNFDKTKTYQSIVALYEEKTGKKAPYAIMPQVVISGPKLSRDYNTNWFATRVNARYKTCMRAGKAKGY